MSDEPKFGVVFLCNQPPRDVYTKLQESFKKLPTVEVTSTITGESAASAMKGFGRGLVLFSVKEKSDLAQTLNALIILKPLISKKVVRVLGFCELRVPKVPQLLQSKGCTEIFQDNLNLKGISYKLERLIGIVEKAYQANKHVQSTDQGDKTFRNSNKVSTQSQAGGKSIQWSEPLTLKSDCWLIQKKSEVRAVRGYWMTSLYGPPPSQGKWAPARADDNPEKAKSWKWALRDATSQFNPDGGYWVFNGRRPEFSWKTFKWQFVGEKAALFYVDSNGKSTANRFYCPDAETMNIAKNSEQAKKHFEEIQKLLTSEKQFEADGQSASFSGLAASDGATADNSSGGVSFEGAFDDSTQLPPTPDDDEDFLGALTPHGNGAINLGKADPSGGNVIDKRGEDASQTGSASFTDTNPTQTETPLYNPGLDAAEIERAITNLELTVQLRSTTGDVQFVRLMDVFDEIAVIETEMDGMTVGSSFSLEIQASLLGQNVDLKFPSTIAEIEPYPDGVAKSVTLSLVNVSPENVVSIQEIFASRQQNIGTFMKAAKGDE